MVSIDCPLLNQHQTPTYNSNPTFVAFITFSPRHAHYHNTSIQTRTNHHKPTPSIRPSIHSSKIQPTIQPTSHCTATYTPPSISSLPYSQPFTNLAIASSSFFYKSNSLLCQIHTQASPLKSHHITSSHLTSSLHTTQHNTTPHHTTQSSALLTAYTCHPVEQSGTHLTHSTHI